MRERWGCTTTAPAGTTLS